MNRSDIEKDIYEESHDLDFQFIPWSNKKVVEFAIKGINRALEEAEAAVDVTTPWSDSAVVFQGAVVRAIRALKIQP